MWLHHDIEESSVSIIISAMAKVMTELSRKGKR